MKKALLFIFLIFLTIIIASCSTQPSIIVPSCSTQPALLTEEVVKELSSDQYAGRLVGTEGNEKVSEFLADTFSKYGIEPLLDSGYFQEYTQKVAVPAEQQPEIVITNSDGTKNKLTYGEDYILGASAEDLSVNMPLCFDLTDKDINDTVPVISSDQIASRPKGCKIFIVSRQDLFFAPAVPQPEDNLRITVTDKVREKMLADGAESIEINLKSAVRDYTARNVVAAIKGEDSTKAIVLTAHFDHAGQQGDCIFPGALDNASGTAAVLSAAVKIKEALGEKKPDTDIIFACVNSEECSYRPLVNLPGSTALVEKLAEQYTDIYGINIDCVGGKNVGPLIMTFDGVPEGLADELRAYLQKNSVEFSTDEYEGMSDHIPFLDKGFGAMAIGQAESSDAINKIHTQADTATRIDFGNIDRIAASLSEFVIAKGAEIFDSSEDKETYESKFDDPEWMLRSYQERDRILGERKLKYNEGLYYMYDGEPLFVTGFGPLTSLKEIRQYYGQTVFPETYLDYKFDNAVFTDPLLSYINDSGLQVKELNEVYVMPTDINEVNRIALEYRNGDEYLLIDITSTIQYEQTRDDTVVQEPLQQEYAGYFLNRRDREDKYYSFLCVSGSWRVEVSTYKKTQFLNTYDSSKPVMLPDYVTMAKTKDEMLALIDTLDIKEQADVLIANAGLVK